MKRRTRTTTEALEAAYLASLGEEVDDAAWSTAWAESYKWHVTNWCWWVGGYAALEGLGAYSKPAIRKLTTCEECLNLLP